MSDNTQQDPFAGLILDKEEQAIEQAIEAGAYTDVARLADSKSLIAEAAKTYTQLNTTKPITLRVNQVDLLRIKAKAKRSSIPYQTLLGAVLHDFATGDRELRIK
jgi:predicted DNA binding CopG/RHH family protein